MKKIYITNKEKTQILTVDADGYYDFININEELFLERAGLFNFEESSRGIIRICRDFDDNVLYDSRKKDNTEEISYVELLNILTVNG